MEQNTTPVVTRCHICGEDNKFTIPTSTLIAYTSLDRRPIQEIWPQATPFEREQLITGAHVACSERWYAFMSDGEDKA